jgi:hypothetical protein
MQRTACNPGNQCRCPILEYINLRPIPRGRGTSNSSSWQKYDTTNLLHIQAAGSSADAELRVRTYDLGVRFVVLCGELPLGVWHYKKQTHSLHGHIVRRGGRVWTKSLTHWVSNVHERHTDIQLGFEHTHFLFICHGGSASAGFLWPPALSVTHPLGVPNGSFSGLLGCMITVRTSCGG